MRTISAMTSLAQVVRSICKMGGTLRVQLPAKYYKRGGEESLSLGQVMLLVLMHSLFLSQLNMIK
jgi:hypothetical protein